MLNVWVNYPSESNPELKSKTVFDVDLAYMDYGDYSLLENGYVKNMLKDVSGVTDVFSSKLLDSKFGFMSPCRLSHGAKVLLLMMQQNVRDAGLIFLYSYCGENCDKYLEGIAKKHDVNISLTRMYIPSDEVMKLGVRFMESGKIVYDSRGFLDEFYVLDSRLEPIDWDADHEYPGDEEFFKMLYPEE